MDVSENSGTPKSSILIGCSITNHPFWGTPIFGNTHVPTTHVCFQLPQNVSLVFLPESVPRTAWVPSADGSARAFK